MSLAVFFRRICSRKESEMQKTHKCENGVSGCVLAHLSFIQWRNRLVKKMGNLSVMNFLVQFFFSVVEFDVEYSPARFQEMLPYKCRKETVT